MSLCGLGGVLSNSFNVVWRMRSVSAGLRSSLVSLFFGALAMNNPWDQLPFPTQGDRLERKTFEGVGRVTSQWEAVEFELSRIYSMYKNDLDGGAVRNMGKAASFETELSWFARLQR